MASAGDSRQAADEAEPPLPPAALQAITAPRAPDAPRRCFICLTDEDPSDPAGTWVDPCPCTLEAHQDCMLSWVTDCERSNRPLKCPVCKSTIEMEGMWDPIVSVADAMSKRFTRASPLVLFTAVFMGIQFSMQMYGAMALWTFSGKDTMMRFVMGPEMMIDGRRTGPLSFARERIANAMILMNIAPALLVAHMFPGWSNKIFLPSASLYGIYNVMHNDHFFTWPPSPQLAMAVFPYIRSVYYNIYNEFVMPHELKLNRQLLGLPPVEAANQNQPQNQNQNANGNENGNGNGNQNGENQNQARNAERQNNGQRNAAQGGLLAMLQNLLDALDHEEDEFAGNFGEVRVDLQAEAREVGEQDDNDNNNNNNNNEFMLEVVVEEVEEDDGQGGGDAPRAADAAPAVEEDELVAVEQLAGGFQDEDQDHANMNAPAGAEPAQNHEAPPAPARRMGLGGILSNLSNMIVSALVLPGVSFAAGEALKLVLPKEWTKSVMRNPWTRPSAAGGPRPGLLQQQWGRSLVGGCVYIVLRDMVRVYAKSRKVAAMANRRVKNVDRPRREKKA